MLKEITKNSIPIGFITIFLSYLKLNLYYSYYDIQILNYIDLQEVLIFFLNDLLIYFFGIGAFYILFNFGKIFLWIGKLFPEKVRQPLESFTKNSHIKPGINYCQFVKVKYNFMVFFSITISIISYLILSLFYLNDYETYSFRYFILCYILITSFLSISIIDFLKYKKIDLSNAIIILYFFVFAGFNTLMVKKDQKTIIYTNIELKTDNNKLKIPSKIIGLTKNYVFGYDKDSTVLIIPRSEVLYYEKLKK